MKPRVIQYFLAQGLKISGVCGALVAGAMIGAGSSSHGSGRIGAVLLALPVGSAIGIFVVWPLIRMFWGVANGGRVQVGDEVHVLAGPH